MIRLTDFPDDILEEIFHAMRGLMCFPGEREYAEPAYYQDEGEYERRNAHTPHRVPLWANVLALSHVCTHWRSLMLTRPRLWTFIRITGSFTNRIMVNEMLERAGTFPLSILFVHPSHLRGQNRPSQQNAVYDVLGVASVISDHSERIQDLGVVLNSSQEIALVLDTLSRCPVPRLEKLWLDSARANSGSGFATVRASLLDNAMPPLRVLHARGISIPWLPYERLVRLQLSCGPAPPLAALLHTLRQSPELEVLVLRIPTARADLDRPASPLSTALDDDEPRAVLPRLRRLKLTVEAAHDAAFSVLPHITFPRTTAVALRFTGRVSSALYEDCAALEELACAVRRAMCVFHRPGFASLSSVRAASPDSDLGTGDGEDPTLAVEWTVSDEQRWAQGLKGSIRPVGPVARLCEGFKAVPLPALAELSVVVAPFAPAPDDPPEDQYPVERFRRVWECVPTVESLDLTVHPQQAAQVFASLAARAREEPPEPEESEADGFGWNEEEVPSAEEAEEATEGEIVCPQLRRLRVTWWEPPSVDDLWGVERCCLARATAGARLECLETVEFPEVVLASLRYHVDHVAALDA